MAKTAMKIKQQRKAKFSTREYNRCRICGRPHAYLRKYGISARSFPDLNETECKRRMSLVEGSGANLFKLKLLY